MQENMSRWQYQHRNIDCSKLFKGNRTNWSNIKSRRRPLHLPNNFELVHCWFIRRKKGQPSLQCNITKCSSVSINQTTKHFLAIEAQVEDTGIKEMIHKLYNEEFNEIQPERKHGVFGEWKKKNLPRINSLWWWKIELNL